MAITPDVIFNTIIDPFGDFYGGSYTYYKDMYATTRGNNTQPIVLGKLLSVDCSELDHTVHISAASGLKKPILKFSNGVELCVSLWCDEVIGGYPHGSYDVYTVWATGCLKKNNTYYYPSDGNYYLQDAGGVILGSQGSVGACPEGIVKQYGIKFCIMTNYVYGIGEAHEGQTKAAYLDVHAFIPFQVSDAVSGFQSYSHLNEDTIYFASIKDVFNDYESNPQFINYGYDHSSTGLDVVFRCDNLTAFKTSLNNLAPLSGDPWDIRNPNDPTQETDPSGPGGGGGNPDPNSDPIGFPSLPIGGALNSGAIKAFKVDQTVMTQVFNKLWNSSIFDISTYQKLTDNPLDSMIALQCIPIEPSTNGTGYIKLGNFDTEAIAAVINQEYYTIDAGNLTVNEYWGSALDYNPYTRAELYVPFSGIHALDVDDIMGKTIHLKYNYSIFDGNMTAQLMCGNSVLYKWPCNVKETIPITSRVMDALQPFLKGSGAMLAAGMMGSGAGLAAATIGAAVNVAMSKTHTSRSGDISGSTGLLDDFEAYLILHRPIQSLAKSFKSVKGYPSNISATLSSLSGYTEVEYIHLEGISGATDTELQEIESLLKEGVII